MKTLADRKLQAAWAAVTKFKSKVEECRAEVAKLDNADVSDSATWLKERLYNAEVAMDDAEGELADLLDEFA